MQNSAFRLFMALPLAALLGSFACGATPEPFGETTTIAQDLGQNAWRPWGAESVNADGFTGSPAVCSGRRGGDGINSGGYVVIGRDAESNEFRNSQYHLARPKSDWTDLSGNRTFSSKPGCATLDQLHERPHTEWNNQIAVVGRNSSDSKYYIQVLKLRDCIPPAGQTTCTFDLTTPPPQPSVKLNWSRVGNSAYASAPAAVVAYDQLLIVGRRSANTLHMYRNELDLDNQSTPYTHSNWQASISVPALPTGWTAQGDPAIANTTPLMGVVTLFTRAKNSSNTNKIYYIYWDGEVFFNGPTQNAWAELPTGNVTIASDPAVEVHVRLEKETLYFRSSDNKIYQASGWANLWGTFYPINSDNTFEGAPAALGNTPLEGEHIVIAKKDDDQFYMAAPFVGSE